MENGLTQTQCEIHEKWSNGGDRTPERVIISRERGRDSDSAAVLWWTGGIFGRSNDLTQQRFHGKQPSALYVIESANSVYYCAHRRDTYLIQYKSQLWLRLDSQTITIDTLPILMIPKDVNIHTTFILQMLVANWTIIVVIRTKVDFTHVSPHMRGEFLSANQANRAAITSSNVVLHQVIQSEGRFS